MEPIWEWGCNFIRAIQSALAPALDVPFKSVTFLGEQEFFLILLPLLLWCIDTGLGVRLLLAFFLSGYVNEGLKNLFKHPRPFEPCPDVKQHEATGYGFPSGHSQQAVVVWGVIATRFRKRWLWVVAVLLMILIGFSRIYLGVHFEYQVLGGWAVGAVCLALYLQLHRPITAWLRRARLSLVLALAIVVPLIMLVSNPIHDGVVISGALLGVGVGLALLERVAPFSVAGPWWQRVVRFLAGAVGLIVLYFGLSLVFPGEGEPLYAVLRFVRYSLVGLWATLGAPWVFLRLRLAEAREVNA